MIDSEKNKLIAKNTFFLTIRMLIVLVVNLYISRIVLDELGITDYGIYTLVAGFVTLFSFLNNSLVSSIQRFFSFELGKDNFLGLRNVFSMTVNIQVIIAVLTLIIAESIGVWFVNNYLSIPASKMEAANWVFQFSLLSLIINILSLPYSAMIIAFEKMNIYAWFGLGEVSLKLILVYLLAQYGGDKLILYSFLILLSSLIVRIAYGLYSKFSIKETKYVFNWDSKLFFKILNYSGWNMWGTSAAVIVSQGTNILLNIFFGPSLNAARGIALQVQGSVISFASGFQTAINPQIVKSYSSNNISYMHKLVFQGAKYSFFILFTLTLPIMLETELLLSIWLKEVPNYAVIFTQLIITNALIDCISGSLMTAAQATGLIKTYITIVSSLLLLILPISYVFLKLNFDPTVTIFISIIISIICLFVRLYIISSLIKLKIVDFIYNVIFRIIPVILFTYPVLFYTRTLFISEINRFLSVSIIGVIISCIFIYFTGIEKNERLFIKSKLINFLKND